MVYQQLNNAGMKAFAVGDRLKAELLFTDAIAIDGSNMSAYINLVYCHLSNKRSDRALAVLNGMRKKCNSVQLARATTDILKLEALASSGIKKRILLVSMGNTFESRLFTLTFTDFFGRVKDVVLDIAMPELSCFTRLEPAGALYRQRLPIDHADCFNGVIKNKYDSMVFIDFPEARTSDLFCRLLSVKGARKIFVNLHLAYCRGESVVSDLVACKKLFSRLDSMFILDNDTFAANRKYGIPAEKMHKYLFSVNTEYYAPLKGGSRSYLISAGNAARDYGALLNGMDGIDVRLKIYTDLELKTGRPDGGELSVRPLRGNIERLKEELGGAFAVVIPFKAHLNPGVNSILTMAMSLGKVVITNETSVLRKLVKDGVNGFFYNENLPGDLRKKIRHILRMKKAFLEAVGVRARETVLAGADYRHVIKKVYAKLRYKEPPVS